MGCNCKVTEVIIAIVVILFTLWSPAEWTMWLVVIAGAALLFHAFSCKNCGAGAMVAAAPKPGKKKR